MEKGKTKELCGRKFNRSAENMMGGLKISVEGGYTHKFSQELI